MFDNIKTPKIKCFQCGTGINDWQSKDGECRMTTLNFKAVDNFYTNCPKCRTWNEYIYKGKKNVKGKSCIYCGRKGMDKERDIKDYKLKKKPIFERVEYLEINKYDKK